MLTIGRIRSLAAAIVVTLTMVASPAFIVGHAEAAKGVPDPLSSHHPSTLPPSAFLSFPPQLSAFRAVSHDGVPHGGATPGYLGTFYANQQVSMIPATNVSYGWNMSNEIYLNRSAYNPNLVVEGFNSYDNNTDHCPATGNYHNANGAADYAHEGYEVSVDGGKNWSRTHLLYDKTCGSLYPSSGDPVFVWGPGNKLDTMVMEMNGTDPALFMSRLVFNSSSTYGASWNPGTVITPHNVDKPWAAVFGDTIYVVWDNVSTPTSFGNFVDVQFSHSADGGATWSPPAFIDTHELQTAETYLSGMAVEKSGEVQVIFNAYNITTGQNNIEDMHSTNNGTTWSSPATVQAGYVRASSFWGPRSGTIPQIASDWRTGALYAVWDQGDAYLLSNPKNSFGISGDSVYFSASTNHGVTWGTPVQLTPTLVFTSPYYNDRYIMPAVTAGPFGAEVGYYYGNWTNATQTGLNAWSYFLQYSPDDGATWSDTYAVSQHTGANNVFMGDYTTLTYDPKGYPDAGFTNSTGYSAMNAEYAYPYEGKNYTVTFNENGLPSGSAWWASLNGNNITSTSPSIAISGVPPGYTVSYAAMPNLGVSGTERYALNTTSPPTPFPVNKNTAVNITYSPQVRVNITSDPDVAGMASVTLGSQSRTGEFWAWANSTGTLVESAHSGFSFYAWQGVGRGSYTGTNPSPLVKFTHTMSETAEFVLSGNYNTTFEENGLPAGTTWKVWVAGGWVSTGATYFNETLPAGEINFTVENVAGGNAWTRYTGTPVPSSPIVVPGTLVVNITFTEQFHLNMTVSPAGGGTVTPAGGWFTSGIMVINALAAPGYAFGQWKGTGTGSYTGSNNPGTLFLAGPASEEAVFVQSVAKTTYAVTMTPSGLPMTVAWSGTFNGTAFSGSGPITVMVGSGSYHASASNVTESSPYTLWVPTVIPTVTVTASPVNVTVSFSASYYVSVSSSTGGTAGPSSGWVARGTAVTLSATPAKGYTFSGWQGTGDGSYSGTILSRPVTVSASITEIAVFAAVPVYHNSTGSTTPLGPLSNPVVLYPLMAALLVVGIVVGIAASRKMRGGKAGNVAPMGLNQAAAPPQTQAPEMLAPSGGAPVPGNTSPPLPPPPPPQ